VLNLADIVTAQFVVSVVLIVVVVHVILITVAYLIYLERKISAYIQDRIGPNRVGFDFGLPALKFLRGCLGLGQPLADGLKFMLKEDYTPERTDKALFTLAPMAVIIPALMGFVLIPWGGMWDVPTFTLPLVGEVEGGRVYVAGAPVNVGIIYILAVASLGVYGVTLGGWASNNKYSFLGGLRATAQMISYEIPLALSLLAALLLTGAVMPEAIIRHQVEHGWLILAQPVAAVLFFCCALAESNRAPFDNAEAEQELVGGYHTEYSSMRFALFFLAEYAHMITGCAFFALLFLGGYHLPLGFISATHWLHPDNVTLAGVLAKFAVYFGKVLALVCFMIVIRWTLPRLRYDQVMVLGWQALIPLSLAVVVVTSVMVHLGWTGMLPMLLANAAIVVLSVALLPLLPRHEPNRKIPLYGSRFNPMPGEAVSAAPTHPMAVEDRPVEGTAPVA